MKYIVKAALALFAVCGLAFSQEERPKAAVFIAGSVKDRAALRLLTDNFLIRSGRFQVVSSDAVYVAAREGKIRMRGPLSDADVAKLGLAAGVEYVCVVEQMRRGEAALVNMRMVGVESRTTEMSAAAEIPAGSEIVDIVQRLVRAMLGTPGARIGYGSDFRDESLGLDMVFVQGGTFTMGCTPEQGGDCDDDERPAHSVTVSDFYIGKYEVTQRQWARVMGSNPTRAGGNRGDDNAIGNVSWNDIQIFIAKLNELTGREYRLPTEAEWEFAARGGNQSRGFKYAGSNYAGDVGWHENNSGGSINPVGTKLPNELGIHDMSGNVREFVNDWRGTYTAEEKTDPTGPPSGSSRSERGGDYLDSPSKHRVSYRDSSRPDSGYNFIGFRLAHSP